MNPAEVQRWDILATVMDIRWADKDTFWIDLYAPQIARSVAPGQFVMLEVPGKFLRRPFSVAGAEGSHIYVLFRVVGEGTRNLSRVRRNQKLRVLGPLGRGFPEPQNGTVLIAGGIGVAPLLFVKSRYPQTVLIYGERTVGVILDRRFLPADTLIATDDGTAGFRGTAVQLAEKRPPAQIFACGPAKMLAAVAQLAEKWNVPAWVSLEARMACGFGVCNGCVIPTATGYARVCTDGPVFELAKVKNYLPKLEDVL